MFTRGIIIIKPWYTVHEGHCRLLEDIISIWSSPSVFTASHPSPVEGRPRIRDIHVAPHAIHVGSCEHIYDAYIDETHRRYGAYHAHSGVQCNTRGFQQERNLK